MVREMSRGDDAEGMLLACQARARQWMPVDRSIALSRRGLDGARFRIVGSDLWDGIIHPSDDERHSVMEGGLLGTLVHAGRPAIVDEIVVNAGEPATAHLLDMRSLAVIPHYEHGEAVEMVAYLRRAPHAFSPGQLPELVLLSNVFGRALRESTTAQQLRAAEARLREQYHAVSQLGDTVLEQALALKHHMQTLEQKVRERTAELEASHLDSIYMLALASEVKDEDTGLHVRRIERSSRLLAGELGLELREAESIGRAAVLHDVGKMHVPDGILKKPGPLTADERSMMQQHTVAAERILLDRPYFSTARRIARSHHEHWDGTGYPDRLSGETIPLEARIVHLADVYDALVNTRVYKPAWDDEKAVDYIKHSAGVQFDPRVVRAFIKLHGRGELRRVTASAVLEGDLAGSFSI